MTATIRDYRPNDRDAAYFICLKTGDHGKDGAPFYQDDPDALGRIYVGPYLEFAPEFAIVLEDELGVCGYTLGAIDSRKFYDRYEREWRPNLCEQYPCPTADKQSWSRTESAYHLYHHPDYFCPEPYDAYPSHLHIDLLSRAQGLGNGRKMVTTLIDRLRAAGSPGVHLGMSTLNHNAFKFYLAMGFQELYRNRDDIYLGMNL